MCNKTYCCVVNPNKLNFQVRELETRCRLHDSRTLDSRPHLIIKPKSTSETINNLPRIAATSVKAEVAETYPQKVTIFGGFFGFDIAENAKLLKHREILFANLVC